MGVPVIRSITTMPSPLIVPPGGQATIIIDAFDPDQQEVALTGELVSIKGESTPVALRGQVGGISRYTLLAAEGTIEPDTLRPGVFIWTAPG